MELVCTSFMKQYSIERSSLKSRLVGILSVYRFNYYIVAALLANFKPILCVTTGEEDNGRKSTNGNGMMFNCVISSL